MNSLTLGGISLFVAFLTSLLLTKRWVKVASKMGLTGKDMNKQRQPDIPEAGGMVVIIAFSLAIMFYIFSKTFFISSETHMIHTFALLTSILLAGFLGFTDDILGWKIGLRQWQKPFLTIPIAFPIMAINAGVSKMTIPFFGTTQFGVLYPLILIPIGIIGAANGFNLIAGFNGLETGQGIIILSTLGLISWVTKELWISLICFSMVSALFAFFLFNKYPSKIFPGDSLTYSVGALIAIICILGNMERAGFILFIPYFIEFFLKARSKFRAESFGQPTEDGKLRSKYDNVFSIGHGILKTKKMKEWQLVTIIFLIQISIALFVLSGYL